MPVFEFKGFDSAGKTVKGLRDADSVKALRALLKKEGVLATFSAQVSKQSGDMNSLGDPRRRAERTNWASATPRELRDLVVTEDILLRSGEPSLRSFDSCATLSIVSAHRANRQWYRTRSRVTLVSSSLFCCAPTKRGRVGHSGWDAGKRTVRAVFLPIASG